MTSLVFACSARANRLRHTAACQMLRAGGSLAEIGQVLRHDSAQTAAAETNASSAPAIGAWSNAASNSKALFALARSTLVIIWHLLAEPNAYHDLGPHSLGHGNPVVPSRWPATAGAHGPRLYDWPAYRSTSRGRGHWLPARRSISDPERSTTTSATGPAAHVRSALPGSLLPLSRHPRGL